METSCSFATTRDAKCSGRAFGARSLAVLAAVVVAFGMSGCPDCRSSSPQKPSTGVPAEQREESSDEANETSADEAPVDDVAGSDRADSSGESDAPSTVDSSVEPVRIIALGNSYTSAVGVDTDERWPNVLVDRLRSDGYDVAAPVVHATGGWTTTQLLNSLNETSLDRDFDAAIVLIGTNDALSDFPPDRYRGDLRSVLKRATALAGGEPSRVIALTLPDYSVTPVGERIGPEKAERDVETFNDIIREEAEKAGANVVDLAPASDPIEDDPDLLADSLHPGAEIHAAWVDRMYETLRSFVGGRTGPDE